MEKSTTCSADLVPILVVALAIEADDCSPRPHVEWVCPPPSPRGGVPNVRVLRRGVALGECECEWRRGESEP